MFRCLAILLSLTFALSARAADYSLQVETAVGRCIMQHLDGIEGRAAMAALVRACELSVLGREPQPTSGEDGFLVRCRVASDPEWVEYRLVTRRQCRELNGMRLPPE